MALFGYNIILSNNWKVKTYSYQNFNFRQMALFISSDHQENTVEV